MYSIPLFLETDFAGLPLSGCILHWGMWLMSKFCRLGNLQNGVGGPCREVKLFLVAKGLQYRALGQPFFNLKYFFLIYSVFVSCQ